VQLNMSRFSERKRWRIAAPLLVLRRVVHAFAAEVGLRHQGFPMIAWLTCANLDNFVILLGISEDAEESVLLECCMC